MGLLDRFFGGSGSWVPSLFAKAPVADAGPQIQPDLSFERAITLGRDYKPDEVLKHRRTARTQGRPEGLYLLYDEMERFGLGPQLSKVRESLVGADFSITPYPAEFASPDAKTAEARKARDIAEYCNEQLDPFKETLAESGAELFAKGITAFRVEVKPGGATGGREKLTKIEPLPAHRFVLDPRTYTWGAMFSARSIDVTDVTPFLELGSLVLLELGAGRTPLDQRGFQWQCLAPWGMSQFGFRWLGRYLELTGIPFRHLIYDKADVGAKAIALEIAAKSGNAGYAVTPKSIELKLIESTGKLASSGSSHFDLIEWAERWYDKVALGHSQATGVQVGAGSKTSSEEAQAVMRRRTNARGKRLARDFRTGVLRGLARRNFSDQDADRYTPLVSLQEPEPFDSKAFSERVLNLYKAGAGPGMSLAEVVRKSGLTLAKAGEPTLGLPSGTADGPPQALSTRFSRGDAPAPDGIAEEIVAPYRAIVRQAEQEGAAPATVLHRLATRMRQAPPPTPAAEDALASWLLESVMRGVVDQRASRDAA